MQMQQVSRSARPRSFGAARASRPSARVVRVNAKLPKWDVQFDYLVEQRGLKSVPPEDAEAMVASGKWVLVDVRPPAAYATAHPKGAINCPMYQPLDWSKPDLAKVIKTIAYAANGVSPVEPNPEFVAQMKAATQNGAKGLITLCEAGGTLKPSTNFPFGKPSRSLQAAYRCFTEGITDQVVHLERGVYGWYQADLEFEGTGQYKPEIGRTPSAAAEPMLQQIRASTGYQMREGDKK